MNPDNVNRAMDLIEKLSVVLGTTVENLWPAIIAQVQMKSIVDMLICGTILLVSFIFVAVVSLKKGMMENAFPNGGDEITCLGVSFVVSCALLVISFLVMTANLSDWITGIINPQYQALGFILQQIR